MDSLFPALTFGLMLGLAPEHPDKALHAAAGASIAAFGEEQGASPAMSCGLALGAGVLKEVHDHFFGGNVEAADILATGLGCGLTLRF